MKDFYLMLQVTHNATAEEIHSAYRRRSLDLHPDRSASNTEPFLELQQAYAVLSNPAQRVAYDRTSGQTSRAASRRGAEPLRQVEPTGGFREVSLSRSFDTFAPSMDEIFHRLWSNFELLTRPKAEGLESLNVELPLAEEEALQGGKVRILVPARSKCHRCSGHGMLGSYQCWYCQGQGYVTAEYPLEVSYPAGLRRDYVVRVPLQALGIVNFYLTVRFRPTLQA